MESNGSGDGDLRAHTISRLAIVGAPATAVLWIGGTLLAVFLFPSFDWTTNALAEVGRSGESTAPIFDASLFLGSLFGLVFLGSVVAPRIDRVRQVGLGLMGLLMFLVGAGQLGIQQPWFLVVVLAMIFGFPLAIAFYGTGEVFAGNFRLGVLSFWLGLIHLLAWDILSNLLEFSSAIPTFLTIVLFSVWIMAMYSKYRN